MARPKGSKNKPKVAIEESEHVEPVVLMSRPEDATYETVMISRDKLVIDPCNMRIYPSSDMWNLELRADIKENGLLNALLVRPLKDGKYGIVCGSRRFREGKLANLERFPCHIEEMDDLTAMKNSMRENAFQKAPSPLEWSTISVKARDKIKELSHGKITSDTDALTILSEQIHIAFSTLQGHIAFSERATPELKVAIQEEKIPYKVGQEIARLPEAKQKEVLPKIEGQPRAKAKEIIETVTAKPQKTESEFVSVTIKLKKSLIALLEKQHVGNVYAKDIKEKCEAIIEHYVRRIAVSPESSFTISDSDTGKVTTVTDKELNKRSIEDYVRSEDFTAKLNSITKPTTKKPESTTKPEEEETKPKYTTERRGKTLVGERLVAKKNGKLPKTRQRKTKAKP